MNDLPNDQLIDCVSRALREQQIIAVSGLKEGESLIFDTPIRFKESDYSDNVVVKEMRVEEGELALNGFFVRDEGPVDDFILYDMGQKGVDTLYASVRSFVKMMEDRFASMMSSLKELLPNVGDRLTIQRKDNPYISDPGQFKNAGYIMRKDGRYLYFDEQADGGGVDVVSAARVPSSANFLYRQVLREEILRKIAVGQVFPDMKSLGNSYLNDGTFVANRDGFLVMSGKYDSGILDSHGDSTRYIYDWLTCPIDIMQRLSQEVDERKVLYAARDRFASLVKEAGSVDFPEPVMLNFPDSNWVHPVVSVKDVAATGIKSYWGYDVPYVIEYRTDSGTNQMNPGLSAEMFNILSEQIELQTRYQRGALSFSIDDEKVFEKDDKGIETEYRRIHGWTHDDPALIYSNTKVSVYFYDDTTNTIENIDNPAGIDAYENRQGFFLVLAMDYDEAYRQLEEHDNIEKALSLNMDYEEMILRDFLQEHFDGEEFEVDFLVPLRLIDADGKPFEANGISLREVDGKKELYVEIDKDKRDLLHSFGYYDDLHRRVLEEMITSTFELARTPREKDLFTYHMDEIERTFERGDRNIVVSHIGVSTDLKLSVSVYDVSKGIEGYDPMKPDRVLTGEALVNELDVDELKDIFDHAMQTLQVAQQQAKEEEQKASRLYHIHYGTFPGPELIFGDIHVDFGDKINAVGFREFSQIAEQMGGEARTTYQHEWADFTREEDAIRFAEKIVALNQERLDAGQNRIEKRIAQMAPIFSVPATENVPVRYGIHGYLWRSGDEDYDTDMAYFVKEYNDKNRDTVKYDYGYKFGFLFYDQKDALEFRQLMVDYVSGIGRTETLDRLDHQTKEKYLLDHIIGGPTEEEFAYGQRRLAEGTYMKEADGSDTRLSEREWLTASVGQPERFHFVNRNRETIEGTIDGFDVWGLAKGVMPDGSAVDPESTDRVDGYLKADRLFEQVPQLRTIPVLLDDEVYEEGAMMAYRSEDLDEGPSAILLAPDIVWDARLDDATAKEEMKEMIILGMQYYLKEKNIAEKEVMDKILANSLVKNAYVRHPLRFHFIGMKGATNLDVNMGDNNMSFLVHAHNLDGLGRTAESIKLDTGWEKGVDGQWRMEIPAPRRFDPYANVQWIKEHPDVMRWMELNKKETAHALGMGEELSQEEQQELQQLRESADVKSFNPTVTMKNPDRLTVKDYIDAPFLFAAYPQVVDMPVRIATFEEGQSGRLQISESLQDVEGQDRQYSIEVNSDVAEKARNLNIGVRRQMFGSIVHEIQHYIQEKEGFALGASVEMFKDKKADVLRDINFVTDDHLFEERAGMPVYIKDAEDIRIQMDKRIGGHPVSYYYADKLDVIAKKYGFADYAALLDGFDKLPSRFQQYAYTAGEVEARNVVARMKMPLDERRRSLAVTTEDVPRKLQDVSFMHGVALDESVPFMERVKWIVESDDEFFRRQMFGRIVSCIGDPTCQWTEKLEDNFALLKALWKTFPEGEGPGQKPFNYKTMEELEAFESLMMEKQRLSLEDKKIREITSSPLKGRYSLLSQMQQEMKYFLHNGPIHGYYEGHLWSGSFDFQLKCMKALLDSIPEGQKPEWIDMDEIDGYRSKYNMRPPLVDGTYTVNVPLHKSDVRWSMAGWYDGLFTDHPTITEVTVLDGHVQLFRGDYGSNQAPGIIGVNELTDEGNNKLYDAVRNQNVREKSAMNSVIQRMQEAGIQVFADPGLAYGRQTMSEEGRRMLATGGKMYGFVRADGTILVDTDIATAETPIHEYTHLWAAALRQRNPEEWQAIVKMMRDTPQWHQVRRDYPHLQNSDDIAEEALALYSGERGHKRLMASFGLREDQGVEHLSDEHKAVFARISEAIARFWSSVADFLHIHYTSKEQVADQVFKDMSNRVNPLDFMQASAERLANGVTRHHFIGEQGARNIALGQRSFQLDLLSFAKDSHERGMDASKIKQITGWEIGADGKWRFEVANTTVKSMSITDGTILSDIVDAKDIFRAYPELKGIKVTYGGKLDAASYNNETKTIILNDHYQVSEAYKEQFQELLETTDKELEETERKIGEGIDVVMANAKKTELLNTRAMIKGQLSSARSINDIFPDIQGVIDHEVQHAIQHIEGFAVGGNLRTVANLRLANAQALMDQYEEIFNEYKDLEFRAMNEEDFELAMDYYDAKSAFEKEHGAELVAYLTARVQRDNAEKDIVEGMLSEQNFEEYRRLAGEVEARNVAERRDMSIMERRASLAVSTEDTDREKQIIVDGSQSQSAALEGHDLAGSAEKPALAEYYTAVMTYYINNVRDMGDAEKKLFASLDSASTVEALQQWASGIRKDGALDAVSLPDEIREKADELAWRIAETDDAVLAQTVLELSSIDSINALRMGIVSNENETLSQQYPGELILMRNGHGLSAYGENATRIMNLTGWNLVYANEGNKNGFWINITSDGYNVISEKDVDIRVVTPPVNIRPLAQKYADIDCEACQTVDYNIAFASSETVSIETDGSLQIGDFAVKTLDFHPLGLNVTDEQGEKLMIRNIPVRYFHPEGVVVVADYINGRRETIEDVLPVSRHIPEVLKTEEKAIYDAYKMLQSEHPEEIVLYRQKGFMEAFGDDADVIASRFDQPLFVRHIDGEDVHFAMLPTQVYLEMADDDMDLNLHIAVAPNEELSGELRPRLSRMIEVIDVDKSRQGIRVEVTPMEKNSSLYEIRLNTADGRLFGPLELTEEDQGQFRAMDSESLSRRSDFVMELAEKYFGEQLAIGRKLDKVISEAKEGNVLHLPMFLENCTVDIKMPESEEQIHLTAFAVENDTVKLYAGLGSSEAVSLSDLPLSEQGRVLDSIQTSFDRIIRNVEFTDDHIRGLIHLTEALQEATKINGGHDLQIRPVLLSLGGSPCTVDSLLPSPSGAFSASNGLVEQTDNVIFALDNTDSIRLLTHAVRERELIDVMKELSHPLDLSAAPIKVVGRDESQTVYVECLDADSVNDSLVISGRIDGDSETFDGAYQLSLESLEFVLAYAQGELEREKTVKASVESNLYRFGEQTFTPEREAVVKESVIRDLQKVNDDYYRIDLDLPAMVNASDMKDSKSSLAVISELSYQMLTKAEERRPGILSGYLPADMDKSMEVTRMTGLVMGAGLSLLDYREQNVSVLIEERLKQVNELTVKFNELARKDDPNFLFSHPIVSYSVTSMGENNMALVCTDNDGFDKFKTNWLTGRQILHELDGVEQGMVLRYPSLKPEMNLFTADSFSPYEKWKNLKEASAEKLTLMLYGDSYLAYGTDAKKASEALGLQAMVEKESGVLMTSLPYDQMDKFIRDFSAAGIDYTIVNAYDKAMGISEAPVEQPVQVVEETQPQEQEKTIEQPSASEQQEEKKEDAGYDYTQNMFPEGTKIEKCYVKTLDPKEGEKGKSYELRATLNGKRFSAALSKEDVSAFFKKDDTGQRVATAEQLAAKYFSADLAKGGQSASEVKEKKDLSSLHAAYQGFYMPEGVLVDHGNVFKRQHGEDKGLYCLSADFNAKKRFKVFKPDNSQDMADLKYFFTCVKNGERDTALNNLLAKYFGEPRVEKAITDALPEEKKKKVVPAAIRQRDLVGFALQQAAGDGILANTDCRPAPALIGSDKPVCAFNLLMMALHAQINDYPTSQYVSFVSGQSLGYSISRGQNALPFDWYAWDKYVSKINKNDVIDSAKYGSLGEEEKSLYKVMRDKKIQNVFNLAQTTYPLVYKAEYDAAVAAQSPVLTMRPLGTKGTVDDGMQTLLDAVHDRYPGHLVFMKTAEGYALYGGDAISGGDKLGREISLSKSRFDADGDAMNELIIPEAEMETVVQDLAEHVNVVLCEHEDCQVPVSMYERVDSIYSLIDDLGMALDKVDGNHTMLHSILDTDYSRETDTLVLNNSREGEVGLELPTAVERLNEVYRVTAAYVGSAQRLDREASQNLLPVDARKYDALVQELSAAVLMIREGLPATVSEQNKPLLDYWQRELKENPQMMDRLKDDIDNTVSVIDDLSKGKSVNYAAIRGSSRYSMGEESQYSIIERLNTLPDEKEKNIVVIRNDRNSHADVILPRGASLEVTNEAEGLRKNLVVLALKKEGVDDVRFYNGGGCLSLKEPNEYFRDKKVDLSSVNGTTLVLKESYDLAEEIESTKHVKITYADMITAGDKSYALYIKPENQDAVVVFPAPDDVARFFDAAKHDREKLQELRMSLGRKYYNIIQKHPELKADILMPKRVDVDMSRLSNVNIRMNSNNEWMLYADIDHVHQRPVPIDKQQVDRFWLVSDQELYKVLLAANLLAEKLGYREGRDSAQFRGTEERSGTGSVPVSQEEGGKDGFVQEEVRTGLKL